MRLFTVPLDTFSEALVKHPQSIEATRGKEAMLERLKEAETGQYDWTQIGHEGRTRGRGHDVADFVVPVTVRKALNRGGGRGYFSAGDILPGELFLLEKAFAIEYPTPTRSRVVISLNLHTKTGATEAQVALLSTVAGRLIDDPSLETSLYSLYAGPDITSPTDPPDSFTCDLGQDASQPKPIDIGRIEGICVYNSYAANLFFL